MTCVGGEITVVRAISRLVGGSSIQAIALTRALDNLGYRTTFVTGTAEVEEGTMDHLAQALGVEPLRLPGLQRAIGPHDLRAIAGMRRVLERTRPQVLHTHAAKAGTVGRLAALTARRGQPEITLHTFHGHVLRGYFSEPRSRAYAAIERWLARRTTRIIAVAPEVKKDLVELGVAPAEKVVVIPLGFELGPFQAPAGERQQLRREVRARYGIPDGSPLVTLIARLVPIKRVDRFLRIAERLSGQLPAIRFLIVGDGELTNELMGSSEARRLRDRLAWAGYQKDIPAVCFASDVVALTSDNEGTPVSLIEAHAAGLPAASTDVGGVRQVVEAGVTGYIVPKNDEHSLAEAIASLISDPTRAAEMGARGRERVLERFTMDRLIADVDALYRELLSSRRSPIADTATVEVRR